MCDRQLVLNKNTEFCATEIKAETLNFQQIISIGNMKYLVILALMGGYAFALPTADQSCDCGKFIHILYYLNKYLIEDLCVLNSIEFSFRLLCYEFSDVRYINVYQSKKIRLFSVE